MRFCTKCGKEIAGEAKFCTGCGAQVPAPVAEKQPPVTDAVVTESVPTEKVAEAAAPVVSAIVPNEEMSVQDTGKKKKRKAKKEENPDGLKAKIKENGKKATVNFIIKKGVSYLLTIALSVGGTLFAQSKFVDSFKEYYNDYLVPVRTEAKEIGDFIDMCKNKTPKEFLQYYKDNNLQEKTDEILYKLSSYSSDNKDVMILHNAYTRFFMLYVEGSATMISHAETNLNPDMEYKKLLIRINDEWRLLKKLESDMVEKYNIKEKD